MSLVLNGTSQYLWLASSLLGSTPSTYTLAAWVKGAAQSDRRVVALGDADSGFSTNPIIGVGTGSSNTSKVRAFVRTDSGVASSNIESGGVAYDSTWHHIALVVNGTSGTAFTDGVGVAFTVTPGTTTLNRTSIGGLLRAAAGSFFAGKVAEAGLWLSDQSANIPDLANATAAHRPSEYPSGLVAYPSLLSDATDTVGNSWTYVDSAHTDPDTPTFDAADHPTMVSAGRPRIWTGAGLVQGSGTVPAIWTAAGRVQ